MHGEHHHHHHHGDHDHHHHDHGLQTGRAGPGHNRQRDAVQWQVPHRPEGQDLPSPPLRDIDLVEASFVEGFARASDVTSFLRLAGIPFVGLDAAGRALHLLRIEAGECTDVGSVVPLLGGQGVRYDPLPARMTSRRRDLGFLYHDGRTTLRLSFAEARNLEDRSDASRFDVGAAE